MTGEQTTGPGPATDRRRIGVWENEGGHLALGVLAATEAPAPTDATARWMRAVPLSDLPEEGAIHLELAGVPICLARSDGVVHALADGALEGRPAWVRDGAAAYFAESGDSSSSRLACPVDVELTRPLSAGAYGDATRRARACFERQLSARKDWRAVK